METFKQILTNEYFIMCAMAVVVFIVTQLLKLPIKAITKKTIKDEKVRKRVNVIILIIPFAFGLLLEFLYNVLFLHNTFTGTIGLGYGMSGISLYAAVEKFFGKKKNSETIAGTYQETEEGKAVIELVDKISEDGKVDKKDVDVVQEFLDKINKWAKKDLIKRSFYNE